MNSACKSPGVRKGLLDHSRAHQKVSGRAWDVRLQRWQVSMAQSCWSCEEKPGLLSQCHGTPLKVCKQRSDTMRFVCWQ